MISYVIASYRPDAVKGTLQSIHALPIHEHEIIVCTPYPEKNYNNVRFILDDKKNGSTYAFNKGVSHSNGDWVVVGIDDHAINYDVYKFLDIIQMPQMNTFEYQVINLGSPWTDCIARNASGYKIDMKNTPDAVMHYRWPVITFPAVSRKTIVNKFNGHLFHPDLLHHFVDHWMGLYVSKFQPTYNFNLMGNSPAWVQHWPGDNCDRSQDATDSNIFCNLAAKFIQTSTTFGYTDPL